MENAYIHAQNHMGHLFPPVCLYFSGVTCSRRSMFCCSVCLFYILTTPSGLWRLYLWVNGNKFCMKSTMSKKIKLHKP